MGACLTHTNMLDEGAADLKIVNNHANMTAGSRFCITHCWNITQVVPDVHIMAEVDELLNGAHMAPIGSRMQRCELIRISAVNLVTQLPYKQIYEGHPALLGCHMDWRPALFRSHP